MGIWSERDKNLSWQGGMAVCGRHGDKSRTLRASIQEAERELEVLFTFDFQSLPRDEPPPARPHLLHLPYQPHKLETKRSHIERITALGSVAGLRGWPRSLGHVHWALLHLLLSL